MTGPVLITARTPGYDALMRTLIGTRTVRAETFKARVLATIQQQNDAAETRPARKGRA